MKKVKATQEVLEVKLTKTQAEILSDIRLILLLGFILAGFTSGMIISYLAGK